MRKGEREGREKGSKDYQLKVLRTSQSASPVVQDNQPGTEGALRELLVHLPH